MKKINKIITEIESSLKRLDMFIVLIKTLVLLMVSYLILFMLGIEPFYAFIPAIIYFLSSILIESRIDKLRMIENNYPELDEKLRTARDNRKKDNIVMDSLEEDIITNLKNVRLSRFFSSTRALILIFLLVFSVSASLYIASKNLKIMDFNSFIDDAVKSMNRVEPKPQEEITSFTGGQAVMQVGNEKVSVQINPVGMDFDFNDVQDAGDYDFSTEFPNDVFISSEAVYESEFTEEQQALIKRYFDKQKG